MKVTQEKQEFRPITITLEHYWEACALDQLLLFLKEEMFDGTEKENKVLKQLSDELFNKNIR